MQFTRQTFKAQPYLYVERECAYDGPAIAAEMGAGIGQIMGFVAQNGIKPASAPMSIYMGMDPDRLRFRSAVLVSPAGAAQAGGPVKVGALPAGDAICATHIGPYASLNVSHRALWSHMEAKGIPLGWPIWETYLDDPGKVAEDKLRTEICRAVAR